MSDKIKLLNNFYKRWNLEKRTT